MKQTFPLSLFAILLWIQSFLILSYLGYVHTSVENVPDFVYLLFLPILQMIFGIWAWKGSASPVFSKVFCIIRIPFLIYVSGQYIVSLYPSSIIHFSLRSILIFASIIEITIFILTLTNIRKTWWKETNVFPPKKRIWTFEEKNRLLFGTYIISLGLFLLVCPNCLLTYLFMPEVYQIQITNIVAMQLVILGIYNLIASFHGIKALIDAGIHGGIFTSIVFVILVSFGYLHPITLLIPMIDIMSILFTIIKRFKNNESI
ncbi:MAG: hypothetical protein SH817_11915 [Leptospira sp.]|nr:hypothetical protein [Leptospira sp.]